MVEIFKLKIQELNFFYKTQQVLKNIHLDIAEKKVTALMGPSGCGKTTLLRCVNLMHELVDDASARGKILLYPDGINLLSEDVDPLWVRKKVGMVFQKPNPFPKTLFDNVAYGLRLRGMKNGTELEGRVEKALLQAGLWNEVNDRLQKSALALSGGQQQRLCIARALAVEPEILLLDEPTSALDPISTAHIEEQLSEIKKSVTIMMVTHNLHQAARCADDTVFMLAGEVIEKGRSQKLFTNPQDKRTENYITGRFG
ncbi:MAG: phosphate ABC transporter ATP-binding protein PstB [Bdellovibrionales bacterium]